MSNLQFRTTDAPTILDDLIWCTGITSGIARDRGIVLPSAARKRLAMFKENACVLDDHPWLGEDPPDVTRLLGIIEDFDIEDETDDGGGYVKMGFRLSKKNPNAVIAEGMIEEKILRAVSIGWLTIRRVTRTSPRPEIDALPRFARDALLARECDWVDTEIELFELSLLAGAGSDRDALILRAMWDARQQKHKEAEMAADETPKAGDVQGDLEQFARAFLRLARTGHPGLNDALSRLMGVYQSLSNGYCGYGDEPSSDPPAPDVCRASATILRAVADDVEGLAGPPEPQAAAAPSADASARAGKSISKANQEKIRVVVDEHKKRVASRAERDDCHRALEEMLDEITEDAAADDGDDAGTDADRAATLPPPSLVDVIRARLKGEAPAA